MKLHRCVLRLLAGVFAVSVLACCIGIASAQADPSQPPVPSLIDQLLTSTPALTVDPSDQGGPETEWGGVGMFCQNLWVRRSSTRD